MTVPDKKVLGWIQAACQEIQDKLAAVDLIHKPPTHTCGELWEAFLKTKIDIKESTMDTYLDSKNRFLQFFKPGELLDDLTPAKMELWKSFLRVEVPRVKTKRLGLAESTVAGSITKTKAVFNWAKRVGWMDTSPLDGVGRGSFVNKDNDRFVTMDEYRRLLDASPCLDWRAIIALARIGGLRCPSELLRLRWSDVNWEKSRFYVTSSKTERYRGKGGRLVPLFPLLREELERLFFRSESEGTEYVINRYRDPVRMNLGTQFARIVKIAGVEEIKRPFDNLRASRSNEVYAEFGAFLESVWIGHSAKVARDHYLQVREEDFERAVGGANPADVAGKNFPSCENEKSQRSKNESQRKSQLHGTATDCKPLQTRNAKGPQNVDFAALCGNLQSDAAGAHR